MIRNHLDVKIYDSTWTEVLDVLDIQAHFSGLRFSNLYPGGKDGTCTVNIPHDSTQESGAFLWKKLALYSEGDRIWQGEIIGVSDARQGDLFYTQLEAVGSWGLLENILIDKRWADNRLTDNIWVWDTSVTGSDVCLLDRTNRLRFTPKAEAWANSQSARLTYTMPVGETVKRLKYDYDLQEAAQSWEISVWRSTDGISYTQMTNASGETYNTGTTTTVIASSGTGSIDVELATASRYVQIRYYARANQTPTSDGTYYGEITNLMVYSETDAAINFHVIISDLIAAANTAGLVSADTWALKSSLTYTLEPFYTVGMESYASIIRRAAAFGSASQEQIFYGLGKSSRASDGLPLMFSGVGPDLSSETNYQISFANIGGAGIRRNYDGVYNYIILEYQDELRQTVTLTPADDASLTDTDSVALYGTRAYKLQLREATQAMALNAGQRFLAQFKDLTYAVTGPIKVIGSIQTTGGFSIPASQVIPGRYLTITDYYGTDGNALSMLITATAYNHDDQSVSLTLGIPDDWSVFLAQQ